MELLIYFEMSNTNNNNNNIKSILARKHAQYLLHFCNLILLQISHDLLKNFSLKYYYLYKF